MKYDSLESKLYYLSLEYNNNFYGWSDNPLNILSCSLAIFSNIFEAVRRMLSSCHIAIVKWNKGANAEFGGWGEFEVILVPNAQKQLSLLDFM